MSADLAGCDSYVTMLKARRNEEDRGRRVRAQRRADFVTANIDFYEQRSLAMRRRLMDEKLRMTSHAEHEIVFELDTLSKWRNVMFQNVVHRDAQHRDAAAEHEELTHTHFANLLEHETARVEETVRDDQHRYQSLLSAHEEARQGQLRSMCGGIVADVLTLAERVIDFAVRHDLDANAREAKLSVWDMVPRAVVREWTLQAVYRSEEAVSRVLAERHITQQLYDGADPVQPNVAFCSLVNKILRAQYPRPPPFAPKEATGKPLVVLLGPKYSGKSAVASMVAEQLGLECVSDTSLVEDALAEASRDIRPEDLSDEAATQLIDLGRQARAHLLAGDGIPPLLINALLLHRIHNLAPTCGGLILDGVPASEAAFTVLEAELSGYDPCRCVTLPDQLLAPLVEGVNPDDTIFDVARTDRNGGAEAPQQGGKEAASAPAAAGSKKEAGGGGGARGGGGGKKDSKKKDEPEEPLPPIELPVVEPLPPLTLEEEAAIAAAKPTKDATGVSRIVHIECTAEHIFERFAGLRVDVETGRVYHIPLDPPPLDRVPHIVPRDRTDADAAKLHRALRLHSEAWLEVERWAQQFEGLLSPVDGSRTLEDVAKDVTAIAAGAMEAAQEQREVREIAQSITQQRAELEQLYARRMEARESVRQRLAAIYTERGVENLPPELQATGSTAADASAGPSGGELSSSSALLLPPPRLPPVFLRVLDAFTEYYIEGVSAVHQQLVKALHRLQEHHTHAMAAFRASWDQPDTLQQVTDAFVAEFNAMQPALRRDVQGKEELHLRIDRLADTLHAAVAKRRDEAAAVIEAASSPATYLDLWADGVRVLGASLAQLEVERFFVTKQLSVMYFAALRNEPCLMDEGEVALDVLPPVRGLHSAPNTPDPSQATAAAAAAAASAAAGGAAAAAAVAGGRAAASAKDKKPLPKKGAAKAVEEAVAERPEEIVNAFVEKLLAAMRAVCDKMLAAQQQQQQQQAAAAAAAAASGAGGGGGAGGKGAKRAAEVHEPVPVPLAALHALPLVQTEFELAKQRLAIIADFTNRFTGSATARNAAHRVKLLSALRRKFVDQLSATNTVVHHIRCAVEEERPVHHRLLIAGASFAVDRGAPLAPTPGTALPQATTSPRIPARTGPHIAPLAGGGTAAQSHDPLLLSCLRLSRAKEIVAVFRRIAPDYVIFRRDFLRIVRQDDYAPADGEDVVSVDDLFSRLDILQCGAIDWRSFIAHLLFWCEPQTKSATAAVSPGAFGAGARNELHIEGPSLVQLFDQRNDLGPDPLPREEFDEVLFFFEGAMADERLAAYREVLWDAFVCPSTGLVDPNVLVMFLCPDPQPLRGAQKAFAMAAAVGDETCALSSDMLYAVFHSTAVNAKAMGMRDVFDWDAIEALAAGSEAVTFQDLCATHLGRLVLNNTGMYRRTSFIA